MIWRTYLLAIACSAAAVYAADAHDQWGIGIWGFNAFMWFSIATYELGKKERNSA